MKKKHKPLFTHAGVSPIESGFTLIELIVSISIIGILVGLATINLLNSRQRATVNSIVTLLGTDINQQQIKAMVGEANGSTITNKGIYFEPTRYTLFSGLQFDASDTANFTVSLDDAVQFTNITFPDNTLLFASISGEMVNFATASGTVTLTNTINNQQKTIMINRYGVITQIQ